MTQDGLTQLVICSNGNIWASNGQELFWREGILDDNLEGNSWVKDETPGLGEEFSSLSCGKSGHVVWINGNSKVVTKTRVTKDDPAGLRGDIVELTSSTKSQLLVKST